jgi:hypothetical protein
VLCAVAALALCACSNDDAPESAARIPLTVKATIAGMNTRAVSYAADGTGSFEKGDVIKVTCGYYDADGDIEYDWDYKRVNYVFDGTKFVPEDDAKTYYFEPGNAETVYFFAQYTIGTSVRATTSGNVSTYDLTGGLSYDVLEASQTCSASNPVVTFQFTHKYTKLTLNFSTAVSECKLSGATDGYRQVYKCYLSNDGKKAETLVFTPTFVSDAIEVTTTDGIAYKIDFKTLSFAANTSYVYTVNLHEGVTVVNDGTSISGYSDEITESFDGTQNTYGGDMWY